MSCKSCLLPSIMYNYCPIHIGNKELVTIDNLENWLQYRYKYPDDEVMYRNLAMEIIYGHIPNYCLFADENDFIESNWSKWWYDIVNNK